MFEDVVSEYEDHGMAAVVSTLGELGALAYTPDLGPIGSGSSYYPRDTSDDARALNYLGFFPDPLLAAHVGTRGSQSADMAANVGAWSPVFRQAVTDFQAFNGLPEDGWIGPVTRTRLAAEVAQKNANGGIVPMPPLPNVLPGPAPSPPSASVVRAKSDHTLLYVVGGGLALLGIGWALTR